MFELMNKLNWMETIGVAFSGGVDSVALTEYLISKKFNVVLFYFDHHDVNSEKERAFVLKYAHDRGLTLVCGQSVREKPVEESKEEFWRKQRYDFLHNQKMQIATGHTLNDVVEWYLFTCMHGEGHIMPYQNKNVIRPLLLTPKEDLIKYCVNHHIAWCEDASNVDVTFAARNRIRHNILPEATKINPGLFKVIKKKLMNKWRIQ